MSSASKALDALEKSGEGLDRESENFGEAAADGSGDLFEQVRERIVRPGGLYLMCNFLIGFHDLRKRTHLALSMFYEDDSILSKLAEFPKSHYKTSIGTVGKTLHRLAGRVIRGEDVSDRIALASNTKTNSQRFLRLIKNVVQDSTLFQNFLPELVPEFSNEDVWNQSELIFPRTGAYTDPTVDTIGVGGASTSRHYTLIIEDDMLKEEDADSPSAIKKAIELHQYYTSLLVPGVDGTKHHIVNEHAWTDFDLNRHIIDNEPRTAVFSVGATQGLHRDRTRHIPDEILKHTACWDDGDTIYPEHYGHEEMLERREKLGARIYNAVYENNPYDGDVVDFKEEWLRFYEFDGQHNLRILPSRGCPMEIVPFSSLNVVSAFDPAIGVKSENDRSAHAITGVDPLERVFLLSATAKRITPLSMLDVVFKEIIEWGVERCAVESVLFQKVLCDLLVTQCRQWNEANERDPLYIGTFEEINPPKGKNKSARIRNLIGTSFENGRVYVQANQIDFIDEYLHFPVGRTVDLLDAFAYTAQLWAPGLSDETYEELEREEQAFREKRCGITGY